jgi:hypothetical protein
LEQIKNSIRRKTHATMSSILKAKPLICCGRHPLVAKAARKGINPEYDCEYYLSQLASSSISFRFDY